MIHPNWTTAIFIVDALYLLKQPITALYPGQLLIAFY